MVSRASDQRTEGQLAYTRPPADVSILCIPVLYSTIGRWKAPMDNARMSRKEVQRAS